MYAKLDRQLAKDWVTREPKAQKLKLQGTVGNRAQSMLGSAEPTLSPQEMPAPPDHAEMGLRLGHDKLKIQDKFRGHWVLRDPEIAITREERREDPW